MKSYDFSCKINFFYKWEPLHLARVILRHSPFDGGTPIPLPRGDLPPRVFLPRPRCSHPTLLWRSGTPRKHQHQHDGVVQGAPPTIVPRGLPLTRLGGIPLSLTMNMYGIDTEFRYGSFEDGLSSSKYCKLKLVFLMLSRNPFPEVRVC